MSGKRYPQTRAMFPKAHALGFPGGMAVKNLLTYAEDPRDTGSVPGTGRSPGGGNGKPLQHTCLENSMDRGTW